MDDYLPCAPRKGKAPFQQPMFADLSDGEMYVPLLEKAFAKLFGSYQELHYGTTGMAFAALTGCCSVQRFGAYLENVRAVTKGSAGQSLWEARWVALVGEKHGTNHIKRHHRKSYNIIETPKKGESLNLCAFFLNFLDSKSISHHPSPPLSFPFRPLMP